MKSFEEEEDAEEDEDEADKVSAIKSSIYTDQPDRSIREGEEADDESFSDPDSMNFGSTVHLTSRDDADLEACDLEGGGGVLKGGYSCMGTCLSSVVLVVVVCVGLFLGRTYVKSLLVWVEGEDGWVSVLLFAALFTLVSFPFCWGYILLNVVAGYLYGFFWGLLVTVLTVLVGTLLAHLALRHCLNRLLKLSFSGALKATLLVLGGPHTFRVVAFTRLTPIPFGLQNALFAMSPIGTGTYLVASGVGLLPTQAINAYLGSTLRSMEDVLSDNSTQITGYLVFAVQVVISVGLTAYVVHKAKAMLKEVMLESALEERMARRLADDDGNASLDGLRIQ